MKKLQLLWVALLLLSSGAGAPGAETVIYFPDYVDGGGWSVQLVLNNVDPSQSAPVEVEVYDQQGRTVPGLFGSENSFAIPALGSRILRSPGGRSVLRGWIQVKTESASVHGLLTYRHGESGIEVGVRPVSLNDHFALYVEESSDIGTGLAIFKPDAASEIEFQLRDEAGLDPLGRVLTQGNFQQRAHVLPEWFAGAGTGFLENFRGLLFLRAADGSGFAPMGLRGGKRQGSLSAVPLIPISGDGGGSRPPNPFQPGGASDGGGTLYFPDYVDGGGWSVQLVLNNIDPNRSAPVEVEVYDQQGRTVPVFFDAGKSFAIPARGSRVLRSPGGRSVQRGWIQVETESASVHGLLTYRHGESGIEVGVEAVPLNDHFALYVEESSDIGTGLAIFKPDAASEIEFQFRDEAGLDPLGGVLTQGNFQQRAHVLPEWFAGVNTRFLEDFRGLLFLRAANGSEFAPMGLRGGKRQSSLSAVPLIPISGDGGGGGGGGLGGLPPDLAVVSLSVSDDTLTAGQSFELRAEVRNQGGSPSTATTLRYYLSNNPTISTSDTEVGTDAVGALAAAGTSAESIELTAPSSAGTYYYGACVDPVSGESSTRNNCSSVVQVTVSGGGLSDGVGKMYWTHANQGTILRANLDGTQMEDLVTGLDSPSGLTLDLGRGEIYWADWSAGKIQRANLDGTRVEDLVTGLDNPIGLALDADAGKVYWTDYGTNKIQRANLDGTRVEDLVTADNQLAFGTGLDKPVGLALDAGAGKMYWASRTGGGKIQRANLNGSGVEDLVTGLAGPNGMALDAGAGKMYWTSRTTAGKIQRANLDGSGVEDLVTGLDHPLLMALDADAGKVYWTDSVVNKIQRANLDGTQVEDLIAGLGGQPSGIALVPGSRDPGGGGGGGTVGPSPDLVVDSPAVSDNTLTAGQSFDLRATVRNRGGGRSAATTLRYYQSNNAAISTGDTQVGTDAVSALAAAGMGGESIRLTAPSRAGTYYYGACVDPVSGESSTRNNCSSGVQVTVSAGGLSDGAGKMYWTDYGTDKIQRANLDGSGVEDLVTGLTLPYGLALDAGTGKMYWTDAGTDKVQRANLDGSGVQDLVTGLLGPSGLALDAGGGKMYWTDSSRGKIQRANLDGSGVEDLVRELPGPSGLALDVAAGKMYWTDHATSKIQRANLDGSGVEDLVTTGLSRPRGLALDLGAGKMYWTDGRTLKVQRANLDGSRVEDLVTSGVNDPVRLALDAGGGKMYWTEQGKIRRANLDGSGVEDVVTGLSSPAGIALDPGSRDPGGGGTAGPSPDLVVDSPAVSDNTLTAGQSFDLRATVRNRGGGRSAATTLRYYQSNNAAISTGDTQVGTDAVSALAAAGTSGESIRLTAPSSAGTYYYGACVDPVSGESSTRNNCSSGVQVTVSGGGGPVSPSPDLAVDSPAVSDNTLTAGQSFDLRATVRNRGGGRSAATTLRYYQSNNAAISTGDTQVGTDAVSALAAAGTSGESIRLTAPSSAGTYYYGACVDPVSGESSTRNNCSSGVQVTVSGGGPSNGGGKIYWTDAAREKIQQANLDGSGVKDLVTSGLDFPDSIALDSGASKMYWTDRDTAKIQRANLDGGGVEDLVTSGLGYLSGIALDLVAGKMYWTEYGPYKIRRANLDGSGVEDLVTSGLNHPNGIALDLVAGKMYWTDWGAGKIQRANLDGSGVEDLLTRTDGLYHPDDIALDLVTGKMYWTDQNTAEIRRANLDGSRVEDLVTSELRRPGGIALDVGAGKMYWTDWGTGKIQRANLDGTGVEDLVTSGLQWPLDIALDVGNSATAATDVVRFLRENPRIAAAMLWMGADNQQKPYAEWPQALKDKLALAVDQLRGDGTTGLPEVMTNQAADILGDDESVTTILSIEDAEDLYVANVAYSLMLDMSGQLPWSLDDLTEHELALLLSSRVNGWHDEVFLQQSGFYSRYGSFSAVTGYLIGITGILPAPPELIRDFMAAEGLVGDSRYETIIRTIHWARQHLTHFSGGHSAKNFENHWDYRGAPPLARILAGTTHKEGGHSRYFTAGCHGTNWFLIHLLRAVNIPVQYLRWGGHAIPSFPSEALYLSHGDDPYSTIGFYSPPFPEPYPTSEIPISETTYREWFSGSNSHEENLKNVGRRTTELAVQHLPQTLLRSRCSDRDRGLSNAESYVYAPGSFGIGRHWTVAELEAMRFWERMDAKIKQYGGCSMIPSPTRPHAIPGGTS